MIGTIDSSENHAIGAARDADRVRTQRILVRGSVLMIIVVGGLDIHYAYINFGILYGLPLIVFGAAWRSLKRLWAAVAVLTVLTVLGYIFPLSVWQDGMSLWQPSGLTNRGLDIASMCGIAAVLQYWNECKRRDADDAREWNAQRLAARQIALWWEVMVGRVICILLIVAAAVLDLGTPGQINLPILYQMPLLLIGLLENRVLMWVMLPILLVLTLGGFELGPEAHVMGQVTIMPSANRAIAAVVLVTIAAAVQALIPAAQPEPSRI